MKPKLVNQNNSGAGGRKSFYLKSTDHDQRRPTVMGIKAEQKILIWIFSSLTFNSQLRYSTLQCPPVSGSILEN